MKAYVALLCMCLGGCASFQSAKPVLRDANTAAEIICHGTFGVEAEAAKRGISVEELCRMRDILDPILDDVLRTQRAGVSR